MMRPARLPPGADASDRDHAILEVAHIVVGEVDLVEDLEQVPEHLSDSLVAPVDGRLAGDEPGQRRHPLDLGIELGHECLHVTAVVGVHRPPQQLDVFPGHARSISRSADRVAKDR